MTRKETEISEETASGLVRMMSGMNERSDENDPSGDGAGETHLMQYWAVLVKHRRLIAVALVIALLISILMSVLARPSYRAAVVLDIEKEKASPFDIGSTQTVFWNYDPEFLPTQTRLMTSREVAERVVRKLNLTGNQDLNPSRRGLFSRKPVVAQKKNPQAAQAAVTQMAGSVQSGLTVFPIRTTNLVELSYEGPTAALAADVANAVADAYIDWNLESKFESVAQASKFLATQIQQLKIEIDEKEGGLQAYGREKGIVSADPQANATLQNLEALNRDFAAAVADRVAKEARYREMQSSRPDAVVDSLSRDLITQLRNEQAKLEREYAEKLNVFKPEWPAMQQLKAQIDKSKQNLDSVVRETVTQARENARSDYMTALRREQSLRVVLQGQKSEAMAVNNNTVEYTNLKTEVETKRLLLDSLLKRQAEMQVTSNLRGERISSIRVVDRALPPSFRYRPSYRKNVLRGLFAGLLVGCALAFFLEYLDRSLRTAAQVEQYLKLPALGVISSVGTAAARKRGYGAGKGSPAEPNIPIELLPHTQPRSTVAEAYRAFRAALLLSRAGGIKSIVITSSLPGEGKTSTAVNLAIVLGQLTGRVLLVDADLHKPRLHEVVSVSNRVGLVSILAENVPAADAIARTALPGVFVLPAGPTSPNPSGLLSSVAMEEFLKYARESFDYVIIDSPPVSPVADALLLGHQSDGVVLCVQGGRTPREQVARVRDKLKRSNVRILGVLINNLDEDAAGYGQYYRYYGEGYGGEVRSYGEKLRGVS